MPRLAPQSVADRRAQILDAAKRCFIRDGFHNASMQKICAAARMSAGNLYRYFASKVALIEGLCTRDLEEASQGFAAARRGRDVLDGLEMLMTEYLWNRPRENLCMWTEISAEATRSEAVNRNSRHIYDFIGARLSEVLAQGVANGTLRKGIDVARLATLSNAVFEGLMLRRAVMADFDPRPTIKLYIAQLRADIAIPQTAKGGRK
ncbi:MAG: TetR/AcrR family transcriptional regulator [Proteobacteria bacterium]|nr:TetR/AcrR family transcriptional regulator [Pseudomonadota bacterium]